MKSHSPEELQEIFARIDAIDWSQYHTAYGNASGIETNPKKWWERFLPMSMTMHRHRYSCKMAENAFCRAGNGCKGSSIKIR